MARYFRGAAKMGDGIRHRDYQELVLTPGEVARWPSLEHRGSVFVMNDGRVVVGRGGLPEGARRTRSFTLNNRDREQWIDNDEGLYNWWRSSRQSKTAFIRENRAELDEAIQRELNREPAPKTWRDYGRYRRAPRPEPDRREADERESEALRRYEIHHHLSQAVAEARRRAEANQRLEMRLAQGRYRRRPRGDHGPGDLLLAASMFGAGALAVWYLHSKGLS